MRPTRFLLATALAFSTAVLAQDTVTQTPSAPSSSGGWKRVDPQGQRTTDQVYGGPAADSEAPPSGEANQAPPDAQYPPPSSQNPYPYPQPQNPPNPPQAQYPPSGYPPQAQPAPYGSNGGPQASRPPVPATLTIQAGTYITVRLNEPLSSKTNRVGDAFAATLASPVVVNGIVVAEPGQTVGGRVALAEQSHAGSTGRLGLQLTTLTLVDGQVVPLATQFISRQGGTTPTGQEVGTVAATTGLGAAIGAAADWGTGAAIGAGAGAVAGLVGVLLTHGHDSVVYPEQALTFKIEQPVTISTSTSPQAFRYVEPGEYNQPAYGPNPGPAPYGPSYAAAPPPPAYYAGAYAYPYPYFGYGYYPYYWGPSFAFYYGPGYWRGGRYYGRYYYGHPYYGGRYYAGGHYVAGGSHGGGVHR
ncbi:MAG: hypothetical protein JO319_07665 [Acidobacteriaceae bacterium]|nr:hypothetical protein [Acidobacteriaceae bacterium]